MLHTCLHVAILIWNYSKLRRHVMTRIGGGNPTIKAKGAVRFKLISSDALLLEIGRISDQDRKDDALAILEIAKEAVESTTKNRISG